jgi:hypothetical protein
MKNWGVVVPGALALATAGVAASAPLSAAQTAKGNAATSR